MALGICFPRCCRKCIIGSNVFSGDGFLLNYALLNDIARTKLCYFATVQFFNSGAATCPTSSYTQGGRWLCQFRAATSEEATFERVDTADGRIVTGTIKRGLQNDIYLASLSIEYGETFWRAKRDSPTKTKWDMATNCVADTQANCGLANLTLYRSYVMRKATAYGSASVSISLQSGLQCADQIGFSVVTPFYDGYATDATAFLLPPYANIAGVIVAGRERTQAIRGSCRSGNPFLPGGQWPIGNGESPPSDWLPPCDFDPLSANVSVPIFNNLNALDPFTGSVSF